MEIKTLAQKIELTIQMYRACWTRLDFAGLKSLWDPAEPEPVYLAEEVGQALIGWDSIERYWSATRQSTSSIRLDTWNLHARPLGAELASAIYDLRWIGEFAGYSRPIGGDTRVAAVLRRRDGSWRFIQYVEAPLAPIVYLRRSCERFAESPPNRD
jgi:hypothetical protein